MRIGAAIEEDLLLDRLREYLLFYGIFLLPAPPFFFPPSVNFKLVSFKVASLAMQNFSEISYGVEKIGHARPYKSTTEKHLCDRGFAGGATLRWHCLQTGACIILMFQILARPDFWPFFAP